MSTVHGKVRHATDQLIKNPGYAEHAAHESMKYYLDDWIKAAELLARRIDELRAMHAARLAAAQAGEWP